MAAFGGEPYGRTFACSCGRTHRVEPREVIYSDEATDRLAEACARHARGRRVAVLMDARTRDVAGREVVAALSAAGWRASAMLVPDLPGGGSPVCDDRTKETLARELPPADLLVPVGAGVVCDLGKWLAQDAPGQSGGQGVPFVAFATAASMNGYASANVAPTIGGLKTLLRARPPATVLASPAILRDAPYDLTAAGLGDVLAKSVSSADWYLNHVLFGDYYCRESVGLIAEIEPLYLDRPEDLRARTPLAVEAVFRALLLTGVAMTMAETSAPASGGEHMVSHALDMMSSLDGRPHDLHGRQVGVGTILAAELYRRVLAVESPRPVEPAEADPAFWGPLAPAVAAECRAKRPRLESAARQLARGNAWDRLRTELAPMLRPPEQIADCLRRAGAACSAADIRCDGPRLLSAFVHAREIRSRFTVLDLAAVLGLMPAAAEEIVQAWT